MAREPQSPRQTGSPSPLGAILEATVDGIITIDEQGLVQGFNPAAERIFGYEAAEVIGRNVALLMAPAVGQKHTGYIRRYLETGEAHIIGIGRETEAMRKDGRLIPIDLAVSEVKVGDHVMFTGIVRDITERKQAEQALTEERDFVSAVLDTVDALVVVLDTEGRIVRFNRACERSTGHTLEEVEGKLFWDVFLVPEEVDEVKRVFEDLRSGHFPIHHENFWLTRDRRRLLISWSNTALLDADGYVAYVIGTGVDISDRRKAEEAVVSVSESERQIIGQDLHDVLGQQLTGIALLSKALERRLPGKDRARSDAAEISELAGTALAEVRRLAHGLYPNVLEKLGLSAALEEMANTHRRLYSVSCEFRADSGIPGFDRSTALHLYRIAQEATNNAIKHGKARHVSITLAYRQDGDMRLRVEDDGVGLPEGAARGPGMGLAIMNYRAGIIGAQFEIARRPEGGTAVTCALPHR